MILLTHILIALASMVYTAIAYVVPSRRTVRISAVLIGATIASGTILVVATHSPLMQACTTGLIYLAITGSGTVLAYRKLGAKQQ